MKPRRVALCAGNVRVDGGLDLQVVVTDGETMALVVLRACDMLDVEALCKLATSRAGSSKGSRDFKLAQEADFADKFDNVEAGTPPGRLIRTMLTSRFSHDTIPSSCS